MEIIYTYTVRVLHTRIYEVEDKQVLYYITIFMTVRKMEIKNKFCCKRFSFAFLVKQFLSEFITLNDPI